MLDDKCLVETPQSPCRRGCQATRGLKESPGQQLTRLYTCSMVESGQMHALMDESQGVVEFPEEADQYCSPDTAQRLHEQLQQASAISKKLARLDFEVRGLLLSA